MPGIRDLLVLDEQAWIEGGLIACLDEVKESYEVEKCIELIGNNHMEDERTRLRAWGVIIIARMEG